jgi:hypothetical protein
MGLSLLLNKIIIMKNPFDKKYSSGLIAGIALGTVAAGAVAYLLFTETGTRVRKDLTGHLNRILDALKGKEADTEPEEDHSMDYLHKKHKAPKTDREDLLKHHILTGQHDEEAAAE